MQRDLFLRKVLSILDSSVQHVNAELVLAVLLLVGVPTNGALLLKIVYTFPIRIEIIHGAHKFE